MTQNYRCGDYAALMGYLYDDCEAGEREAIAAHLHDCRACADELKALAGTRRQLASWAPPDTSLGFQIPSGADESRVIRLGSGGRRETRAAWWREPLPAWAQLAAAMLIFAAGLSIGVARGRAAASQVEASSTTRAALAVLERRINGIERFTQEGMQRVNVTHAFPSEAAILQRVGYQIARSEERQRLERQEELAIRVLDLADAQQKKVEQIETNVAKVQNQMYASLLQQVAFQPQR
jgi:hypothetical protein